MDYGNTRNTLQHLSCAKLMYNFHLGWVYLCRAAVIDLESISMIVNWISVN